MAKKTGETRPGRLKTADKQLQAMALRKTGMTYQRIGELMGLTHVRAFQLVKAGLEMVRTQLSDVAEDVLTLELMRLDASQAAIWKKVLSGDIQAGHLSLKISERRSKYLGLDAPDKVAPTDPTGTKPYDGLDEQQRAERAMALFDQARARRAASALDATEEEPGRAGGEPVNVVNDALPSVPSE